MLSGPVPWRRMVAYIRGLLGELERKNGWTLAEAAGVEKVADADTDRDGLIDTRVYKVRGELFFASLNDLIYQFDYVGDPQNIVIDLTGADIWDASTVATLDATRHKYAAKGKTVEIVGLDGASLERLDRPSGRLGDSH